MKLTGLSTMSKMGLSILSLAEIITIEIRVEELERMAEETKIAQIQLPDPTDDDPHPRLLLEGRGIHAGEWFSALFPDGWHDVTLEVSWEPTGPGCWYISTPGFEDVCPIGLFVKV